jgi:hypothetical protein
MYDQAKRHLEFLATSPALPRDLSSSVAEYLTESAMLYADPMVRNRPDLAVPIFQQALGLYDKLGVANWFCLEQYRDVLKQLGRNSEADAPPSDRSRNLTGRNGTLQELIARGVLAPGFAGAVDGYSSIAFSQNPPDRLAVTRSEQIMTRTAAASALLPGRRARQLGKCLLPFSTNSSFQLRM